MSSEEQVRDEDDRCWRCLDVLGSSAVHQNEPCEICGTVSDMSSKR